MDDGLGAATPNCDVCGHPLEVSGSDRRPYWACGWCGMDYPPARGIGRPQVVPL